MRVALATLGCKVNRYDSAVLSERLRGPGIQWVPFDAPADVYVINSCTVTHRADVEARHIARRARRRNPSARVVMTGCYAQTSPDEVLRLSPVDYVVGVSRLDDLLRVIRGELPPAERRVFVAPLRHAREVSTLGARLFPGQTRAFLKVQEGCDLFCSFCIVPTARGRSRSVPPREIMASLEGLAANGYREVVLTGVHLGSYGADLDPPVTLAWLVRAVTERGWRGRLRLSSIDPHEISDHVLRAAAASGAFCPHFHVPLQSGDDRVLERMRRRYDVAGFRHAVATIRKHFPGAAIGTDVIAGFPGEDEEAFAATEQLIGESQLSYVHVFPYAVRHGTTAAKLPGHLPAGVIHRRAQRLREVGRRLRSEFTRRWIGRKVRVLLETTPDPRTGWSRGYSREYVRVVVPDAGPDLAGREVPTRIEGAAGAIAVGRLDLPALAR